MYSTVININSCSPALSRPLIPPSNLPCDPVDLRIVDHPMSDLFSVFAVFSASNTISFVVAVPDELANYSLFLHEQLQLPQRSSWTLCNGSFESTILIANETTVYHMDISPWLENYAEALGGSGAGTGSSSSMKSTVARELITTLPCKSAEKSELPHFSWSGTGNVCGCPSCISTRPRAKYATISSLDVMDPSTISDRIP
ncbi:hypothetical protein COOONC_07848 [Cooperia oncophora]